MHTLHIYALRHKGEGDYLTLVRAVRAARVVAGVPGSMSDAAHVLDVAMAQGHALVCEHGDYDTVLRAQRAAGGETECALFAIDRKPEWFEARARAEAGLTPEQSIAAHEANEAAGANALETEDAWSLETTETALVLMHAAGGNPAGAVLLANRLRATTGDDLYGDVSGCLLGAFRPIGTEPPDDG